MLLPNLFYLIIVIVGIILFVFAIRQNIKPKKWQIKTYQLPSGYWQWEISIGDYWHTANIRLTALNNDISWSGIADGEVAAKEAAINSIANIKAVEIRHQKAEALKNQTSKVSKVC